MLTLDTADTGPYRPSALAGTHGEISVTVTSRIEDVEALWRTLTVTSIESPGQNYDFIRLWIADRNIPPAQQSYVVGRVDGRAIVLLPLHRKRVYGLPVLTWFPGSNAGCYAPIADHDALAALRPEQRDALWAAMARELGGADLIYLRSIPIEVGGHAGLFDSLGSTLAVEAIHRSQYSSWVECDTLQRSKSRRKHDRQQGDRLTAMGAVDFEEIRNGGDTAGAIEIMFRQRSARFKVMGIRDSFILDRLVGFYQSMAEAGSGVDVRLHILRLNGEIVAVRYNIVHHDRMFCLISSMSDDPAIQGGSPGKQCLLRVMQTVFDDGIRIFDMGSGFTDEKRHWCNVQTPLRQHYVALTLRGAVIVKAHQAFQKTRAAIKGNRQLKAMVRGLQQAMNRVLRGGQPATSERSE